MPQLVITALKIFLVNAVVINYSIDFKVILIVRATPTGVAIRGAIFITAKMAP